MSVKVLPNGDVSYTVQRMEKKIRAKDGTWRTLVSYDGVTWGMDVAKEQRRVRAVTNLHGKRLAKKQKAENKQARLERRVPHPITRERQFQVANNQHASEPRRPHPVILPVTPSGSPMLGKAKGKNQKYRRNLKKRVVQLEPKVELLKPVHYHRCHYKRYPCSCDTPWQRRLCGGDKCLYPDERLRS